MAATMTKRLLLVSILVLGKLSSAFAEFYSPYVPDATTPLARSGAKVMDVARSWASSVPQLYFAAYGHWPENWRAIEESGIFTAPLRGIRGETINPDDKRFDFPGDLHYMYKGPQSAPVIAVMTGDDLQDGLVVYDRVEPVETYRVRFASPPSGATAAMNESFALLAAMEHRYQQIAVKQAYWKAAMTYLQLHGSLPTWEQLQQSGLSPHAPGTVNPLTGKAWAGDGSPNDLLFQHDPAVRQFKCWITDDAGQTPWIFS